MFCETNVQYGKKNAPKFESSLKNWLEQWWTEHSCGTHSPCLHTKTSSVHQGVAVWHVHACMHTLCDQNLFFVIFQEMKRLCFSFMNSIVTLTPGMTHSSLQRARLLSFFWFAPAMTAIYLTLNLQFNDICWHANENLKNFLRHIGGVESPFNYEMFVWPPAANCFYFWLFDWFFSSLSAICFLFKENHWESPTYCSYWNISQKHFFALRPPTLGSVAQTTHAQKIRSW